MTAGAHPQETWSHQVTSTTQPAADWIWQGFITRGGITLLTSQWKAGKTTLLSMLLSRRLQGGTLAGLPVQPGKSVVVSEEALPLWADRARRYDFGANVCFFSQPFRALPSADEWQGLLTYILALRQQHGLDFVVFDPLAPFCRGENQSKNIFDTLLPLRALTCQGVAVMLMHHPAKGDRAIGQAARGSGALLGHVDIAIEMRHPGGDQFTRRRRLQSLSRHAETPRQLLVELNPEATDYLVLPEPKEDDSPTCWHPLQLVLEDAQRKLTRLDILEEWPSDFDRPNGMTLWRALDRGIKLKLIAHDGSGRRSDPFRYWLPEREAIWEQDPVYRLMEEQRQLLKELPRGATEEMIRARLQSGRK